MESNLDFIESLAPQYVNSEWIQCLDDAIKDYCRTAAERPIYNMSRVDLWDVGADKEDQKCAICLEPFETIEQVKSQETAHIPVRTKCGHTFGGSCLSRWLDEHRPSEAQPTPNCPLCRTAIELISQNENDIIIRLQEECEDVDRIGHESFGVEKLQARIDLQEHYLIPMELWFCEVLVANMQLRICLSVLSPETIAEYMERAKVAIRGISAATGIPIDPSPFGEGGYVTAATISRWATPHKVLMCRRLLDILHGLICYLERRPGNSLEEVGDLTDFESDIFEMVKNPWLQELLSKILEGLHPDIPDWDERVKILKRVGEAHLTADKLWRKRYSNGLDGLYSTRPWLKERLEILVKGFEDFQNGIFAESKCGQSCLGAKKKADMESVRVILKNVRNSLKIAEGTESGQQP
jgi:hypothetical protein